MTAGVRRVMGECDRSGFGIVSDFGNADIDYKAAYADAGFSSMMNCFFPKRGDLDNIAKWVAGSVTTARRPRPVFSLVGGYSIWPSPSSAYQREYMR